jgi:hypothetical protein
MMPKNGKIEMEITIVKDYAISPSLMLEASQKPDKVKQISG